MSVSPATSTEAASCTIARHKYDPQWPTDRIGGDVNLCVQPATRATNGLIFESPFAPTAC